MRAEKITFIAASIQNSIAAILICKKPFYQILNNVES